MRETLLIRLADAPEETVEYTVIGADGKLLTQVQRGTPDGLAAQAAGRRVVLVVPGTDVSLFRVEVPTDNRQRMLRAVPYALEEQLADDVDTLHFALGSRAADGRVGVAVAAREQMDQWRAWCDDAGLEPAAWYAETQLLTPVAEAWVGLEDPAAGRLLLRGPGGEGYAIDRDIWPCFAARLGEPRRVRWLAAGSAETELPAVDGLEQETGGWAQSPLEHLAGGLAQSGLINLCQGDYSRQQQLGRLLRPWRAAAGLLAASLLLALVGQFVQLQRLEAREAELTAQIEQLYRDTFPQAQRVVNARHQMEQQLLALRRAQGQDALDFLGLLASSGEVFSAAEGVELQGVGYRDGQLDVQLTARDLQSLDKLKQQLAAGGQLQVEIQSATAGGDRRVEGRLRIAGAST
ncbi:type II secretion system protein GspL [Thiohalobacter thiocyanaticus]|nr:type II secretion system protein GspL [Thiohalobacter thiocyanaticus]